MREHRYGRQAQETPLRNSPYFLSTLPMSADAVTVLKEGGVLVNCLQALGWAKQAKASMVCKGCWQSVIRLVLDVYGEQVMIPT